MLTPAAAAKRAGCGRSSIMRALDSKELKGERDNRNRWKISPEAIDEWSKNRPDSNRSQPVIDQDSVHDVTGHIDVVAKLAAAEVRIEELQKTVDRADAERERMEVRHTDQIKRLDRLIDIMSKPRPTLLERISGSLRNSRGA